MTNFDPNLDLAYFFAPSPRPSDPGHPKQTIHLRPKPTGRHFDPEYVLIKVFPDSGDVENLRISHPWHGIDTFRVFPGRVILRDRFEKTAESFTFGGDLGIISTDERTSLEITSSAPILDLTEGHTLAEILAEEVEILLAEQQARMAYQSDQFNRKLASLDARTFYEACLVALRQKYQRLPIVEGSLLEKLVHLIQVEIRFLRDSRAASSSSQTFTDLFDVESKP